MAGQDPSTGAAARAAGPTRAHTPAGRAFSKARSLAEDLAVRERQFADSQALAHVGSWQQSDERAQWSDELCRIFGQPLGFRPTPGEFRALVHPDDVPTMLEGVERAGRGERVESWYRIVRPDGEIRHVHVVLDVRLGPDGAVAYSCGSVQDVTERHEAERARREAQELFRAAFLNAPIGMALTALDGRFLKVNPAVSTITGYSEAELLERGFQGITHPDDVGQDVAALEQIACGRRDGYQAEKRYVTRAGAEIWVLLSVALVRDASGGTGGADYMVAQMVDITQRRRAEERLREAEAAARAARDHATAILAAMSDGYALTMNGEIKAVNDALCELTGFSADELIGQHPPYSFWPPEELPAINAAYDQVRARNGGRHDVTLSRADGERFEAEVTTRAARTENGRPFGFVNTFRDVSVQKRHQRELERLARTDSLTLLANRHVLQEALEREAARRGDDGRRLALVLLDLDHFKQVNDAHGHPAGDGVLVEVARRLERTVRAGEVLARVGGEEFAWLLPASSAVEAVAAADRARAEIACEPFGHAGRLTMSAGVGLVATPSDGDALYRMADRALYEAKQRGRDRTCCLDGASPAVPADEPVTAMPAALMRGAEQLDALA